MDNESPTWSSPAKSKGDVYQNDRINFSVLWQDNFELSSFIFSIMQSTSWVNYSLKPLSGSSDYAIQEVQISAAASTSVYWRMYAWDTSGNMNVTDVQDFVVLPPTGTSAPPPEEEEREYGTGVSTIKEAISESFKEVFDNILQAES